MKFARKLSITCVVLAISPLIISGCTQLVQSPPGDFNDNKPRHLYASAGIGISQLQPDTSAAGNFAVDEKTNSGGQITVGADLNKHLSVEAHSADLGSAGLSPSGRINYHINGVSALYYVGGNRHNYRRQGLSSFGRIGYGKLENSAVGTVDFTRINASHILYGAGVEYATRSGLGLRAELISFDTDVKYLQLGMIYRAGRLNKPAKRTVSQTAALPEITVTAHPEPALAAAVAPIVFIDADFDTVADKDDTCPDTPPNHTVDSSGCTLGFEPVYFATDSADLTLKSRATLSRIATALVRNPDITLNLSAHADSHGENDYNLDLSNRRAQSVLDFLADKNIVKGRLVPTSHGETDPADSNDTGTGRQRNRRVDFGVIAK